MEYIDEMKATGISREQLCEILMINTRRVRRWRQNFVKQGNYADCRKGPTISYNKLNEHEIHEITIMAKDDKYSNLSHRELAIRGNDEKRVFASKSTFYRILRDLGLIFSRNTRKSAKKKVPAPKIKEIADVPNRVWSWDFTYVWTGTEWIYLLCILDVFSRKLMNWIVTRTMTDDVALQLWNDTLCHYELFDPESRPVPLWSFSDHGSQMTSKDTKKFFEGMDIPMVYARYNVPEDNGIHESFHKTLKHDKNMGYYYWKVSSVDNLNVYMTDFELYYNDNRVHSGIGDVTPNQMYYGLANDIKLKRRVLWEGAIKKRIENNRKVKTKKLNKEKRVA